MMGLEITDVKLDWEKIPSSKYMETVPHDINGVYVGGSIVLYALIENQSLPQNTKVYRF